MHLRKAFFFFFSNISQSLIQHSLGEECSWAEAKLETLIEKIVWDSETRRGTDHIDMTANVELLDSNKIKRWKMVGKRDWRWWWWMLCSRTKTCMDVISFSENKIKTDLHVRCLVSGDRQQEEKKLINDESVVYYHSRQPLFGKWQTRPDAKAEVSSGLIFSHVENKKKGKKIQ